LELGTRYAGGWSRREADIADSGLGRLSWADSAPTSAASERTGVRALAVIPLRGRNGPRRPKQWLSPAGERSNVANSAEALFRALHECRVGNARRRRPSRDPAALWIGRNILFESETIPQRRTWSSKTAGSATALPQYLHRMRWPLRRGGSPAFWSDGCDFRETRRESQKSSRSLGVSPVTDSLQFCGCIPLRRVDAI
jgi:hypothetical protein